MANNGKAWPLASIVGERLRSFREEKGLRQADIATAAAQAGLNWGRSTIAALESGARNLAVEELIALPLVISNAGGWDRPVIEKGDLVGVVPGYHATGEGVLELLEMLFTRTPNYQGSRLYQEVTLPRGEEQGDSEFDDFEPEDEALRVARSDADYQAWKAVIERAFPGTRFGHVLRSPLDDPELIGKVAERLPALNIPAAQMRRLAVYYSQGLWGRRFSEERDRRTNEKGEYATKRSLQAARGHVTREMIQELARAVERTRTQLEIRLAPMYQIWDDAEALNAWAEELRKELA